MVEKMKYYKCVPECEKEASINTKTSNYGITLSEYNEYTSLLELVTQSSFKSNLPLDFYQTLINKLAGSGDLFLQQIPNSTNGMIPISSITWKESHHNLNIHEDDLIELINGLISVGLTYFPPANYLWEYIFEWVRNPFFISKPSRLESFFLFGNIEDCKSYMDRRNNVGIICEIELVDIFALYKADMNLLELIPDNYTFSDTVEVAKKYWTDGVSETPHYELLFKGICKMTPLFPYPEVHANYLKSIGK
jgi:hypothetical protein